MDDKIKNKKTATTEAQKKDETQKFSVSEDLSDSVVAREALVKRVEELENQNKRVLADYRNLENRVQNERGEWILKANRQLLLNILPVLDTLMLADKGLQDKGLTLSIQQFLAILKREGVEQMGPTRGLKFDPNTMEAISTQEVENDEERVMEELRSGYKLYDSVLRHAQVIVGKKGDAEINSA